jgi:hypothetical protein
MLREFQKFVNKTLSYVDDPHEKFIANVILVVVFWAFYYTMYLADPNCLIVNKESLGERGRLTLLDFGWFSTLTQFGITFGDMVPKKGFAKALVMTHAILAWYILLK